MFNYYFLTFKINSEMNKNNNVSGKRKLSQNTQALSSVNYGYIFIGKSIK